MMDDAILLILLIDSALRATVILGVALGVTFLLRRHSAALRHLVLSLAIAGALLTPLLTLVAPAWRPGFVDRVVRSVQTPSGGAKVSTERREGRVTTIESFAAPLIPDSHDSTAPSAAPGAAVILIAVWIAGVIVLAGILLAGLARLRWLASRCSRSSRRRKDTANEAIVAIVDEIARACGVRRPIALVWNDRTRLLVTWGHFRPRVMLPAAAADWPEERLRVVISHELAHVRRGDWGTQLAAELLRSLFWFNPLVWIACRRLRAESELACDDEVLNAGVEGVDYAGHLIDLARMLNGPRRTWLAAPAMARPSSLEGRISAMLNAQLNRRPVTRAVRAVTCALVLGLTLAVAGFAQSTYYTFSGVVVDSTDRVVPGVELTLTNASNESRNIVKTDANGRFEFVGLPSGDYGLEVKQLGFKDFKDTLAIASGNVSNRRIALQVGQVRETITVTGVASGRPVTRQAEPASTAPATAPQRIAANCKGSDTNVGGNIKPPTKLRHVAPIYPAELLAANIGGAVTMEALIDTQGDVQDVTVLNAPDPGLATAATESVKQWKYTPTLLNCEAIEVRMGVSVTFTPKQ